MWVFSLDVCPVGRSVYRFISIHCNLYDDTSCVLKVVFRKCVLSVCVFFLFKVCCK